MDRSDWPVWLTTNQAAGMLGVQLRTLYRLIDAGELVAYRMGRVIRVTESDVLAYIDAARIQPGDLGVADD